MMFLLEFNNVFFFIYQSGDDDYESLPNADAEIDPPCNEVVTTFSCEKLRKIIKEPRSSCASYQAIFVLSLKSKSSPLPFRLRMVSFLNPPCTLKKS